MRDSYNAAVAAAVAAGTPPKDDAQVKAKGLKLARAQRTATKSLQADRRAARLSGVPLQSRTNNPTTTPDFLALLLREHRGLVALTDAGVAATQRIADAMERQAAVSPHFQRTLSAADSHC